jgi:hypothetical protein
MLIWKSKSKISYRKFVMTQSNFKIIDKIAQSKYAKYVLNQSLQIYFIILTLMNGNVQVFKTVI